MIGVIILVLIVFLTKSRRLFLPIALLTWLSGLSFTVFEVSIRYDLLASLLIGVIEFRSFKFQKRDNSVGKQFKTQSYYWFAYWLLISILITVIVSTAKLIGLWNITQYTLGFMSLVLILKSRRKLEYVKALKQASFFFGMVYCTYLLLSLIGLDIDFLNKNLNSDDGTFQGLSIERNILASQALVMLTVNLTFRSYLKKVGWVTNSLLLILIAVSQTRAVWMALACIALVYLIGIRIFLARVILVFSVITFLVFYLSLSYKATISNDQFANLLNFESGTGEYRVSIYSRALSEVFSDWSKSFFGFGVGTYGQMHPLDRTGVQQEYLSSIWISVLHSTGLIGLSFFILGLVSIVKRAFVRTDALAIVVAIAISATTTSPFLLQFPWIALGIIVPKVRYRSQLI